MGRGRPRRSPGQSTGRRAGNTSVLERAQTSVSDALASADQILDRPRTLASGTTVEVRYDDASVSWQLEATDASGVGALLPLSVADKADRRGASLEAMEAIADLAMYPPVLESPDDRRPVIIDRRGEGARLLMSCHGGECDGYCLDVNCSDPNLDARSSELAATSGEAAGRLANTISRLRRLHLRSSLAQPVAALRKAECVGCEAARIRSGEDGLELGEFWYDPDAGEWMIATDAPDPDSEPISMPTGVRDYFAAIEDLEDAVSGIDA